MKIVDLKCPNCSGMLKKEDDMLVCSSCGASFAIDYDDSDVEHERLQGEAERAERQLAHDKELLEKQYELQTQAQIEAEQRQHKKKRADDLRSSITGFVILCVVVLIVGSTIVFALQFKDRINVSNGGSSTVTVTPTPAPNYNITPEDVAGSMSDFIDAGKICQMGITECAIKNENGIIKTFHKTDAEFLGAYIVSGIPDVKDKQSTRLVLLYKVTWHHDDLGNQTCYDGVYFDEIRVNPNGGIISDFAPKTIWRSDAAWGWAQAYSFEDYDQCYRENVTALGGTVTQIDVGEDTVEDNELQSSSSETEG